MTDNNLFNNPVESNYWQNPYYYLTHDGRGDCEDFSLAFASILEAKDILAQVLGVRLVNGQYHWVIECEFAGHIRYADINRNHLIIFQDENPTIDRIWETIDGECIIRIN